MASLIDSSVWVALFLDFDTQHTKAERLFSKLKGKIYLPYCVLNEVATVLAYKHSKKQANQFLSFIEENHDINLLEDSSTEEVSFYKSQSARISFSDAALLLFARKLSVRFITFDKQLERLAREI
ncbi:MAG: type II toxin-antitoxin system VapC family toxin [bacterium]|nr:type II toxin-antitoxin system VapC family toxin [bacterium]